MLTNVLKQIVFLKRYKNKANAAAAANIFGQLQNPLLQVSGQKLSAKQKQTHQDSLKDPNNEYAQLLKAFQQSMGKKKPLTPEQSQKRKQIQFQNLQLPKQLKDQYKSLFKRKTGESKFQDPVKSGLKQKSVDTDNNQDSSEIKDKQAKSNFFEIETQPKSKGQEQFLQMIKKPNQNTEKEFIKLKQKVILQHIMKGFQQKQVKINYPESVKHKLQKSKQQEKKEEELINQQIRYRKLQQMIKKSKDDPSHSPQNLLMNRQNIELPKPTEDQKWRAQFQDKLVQQAINYKNTELQYFKKLIQGKRREPRDAKRQKGWIKKHADDGSLPHIAKDEMIKHDAPTLSPYEPQQVTAKQEEGLVRYKDDDYYIEKGIKQFQEKQIQNPKDKDLYNQGRKDLVKGNILSDVFLDDYMDPEVGRIDRKQRYEASTFGKYQKKLDKLSKTLTNSGIQHNIEDLQVLNKELLFGDKRIRQEDLKYQQYLLKKEKKKIIKQELKKMHSKKLRDDINFDFQNKHQKMGKFNPADMDQSMEQLSRINSQNDNLFVNNEESKSLIHYKKTFQRVKSFINSKFYTSYESPQTSVEKKIQIKQIISNKKNTVINVFWDFKSEYQSIMLKEQFREQDLKKEKFMIQKKLQRQSTYLSGKMTQLFGFRYAPAIRFYFDQKTQETDEVSREMRFYKREIISASIDQYKQKGVIRNKQDEKEYRKKLEVLANDRMNNMENRKQILSGKLKDKMKQSEILQKRQEKKTEKMSKRNSHSKNQNKMKQQSIRQKDKEIIEQIIGPKARQRKKGVLEDDPRANNQFRPLKSQLKQEQNKPEEQVTKKPKRKKSASAKLWQEIDSL